jgi:hypothetical protein
MRSVNDPLDANRFGPDPEQPTAEVGAYQGPHFQVELRFRLPKSEAKRLLQQMRDIVEEKFESYTPEPLPSSWIENEANPGEQTLILNWRRIAIGRPTLAWQLVQADLELHYDEILGGRRPDAIAVRPDVGP